MNAILLSIGDELVSGLTVNTNSAWLAEQLAALGVRTSAHITVGDELGPVATAIREACEQLELELSLDDAGGILLITGGLGPTEDDVTRQALAEALGQQLVEDPDAMVQVERFFKSINRPMSPSNRVQALRPQHASIIENLTGTAPGLRAEKGKAHVFVMPGVPREMREMFTRSVRPALEQVLAARGKAPAITRVRKINTFGQGESALGERIRDLMARGKDRAALPHVAVGTTVHDGIVSVRIYATGAAEQAAAASDETAREVYARLGPLIFGEETETLEGSLAAILKERGQTLATAESCTGGLLATLMTDTPGSSAYFLRGWVTYANQAKMEELGVPGDLLQRHGAVSEEVARAMAQGARRAAGADWALATTGIAGPDGGTPDKPVGTVWMALAGADTAVAAIDAQPALLGASGGGSFSGGVMARKFIFPGSRAQVRLRAAQMAMALLRWRLLGVSPV